MENCIVCAAVPVNMVPYNARPVLRPQPPCFVRDGHKVRWNGRGFAAPMFEQLEEKGSFGSWAIQSLLAYFGPLVLLIITWSYLSAGEDSPILTLCEYVFIGVVSSVLAAGISSVAFEATVRGRWVWIIPVALFLAALASEGYRNVREVTYMFYVGPGEGEAGLGLVLLTMPTWSCCCYSITMILWRRHHDGNQSSPPAMR